MVDFFQASRAIDDGDAQRLRKLWEDACRYKDELRSSRRASPEDPDGEEPPEDETGVPIRLEVRAHAHATADGGSRTRRALTWIGIGVGLGAALPSLALLFARPHPSSAARSTPMTPQAATRTVSIPASPPPAVPPSGPAPAPRRTVTSEVVAPTMTPVPIASTSAASSPTAPPSATRTWWCTSVIVPRAGVYAQPDTGSMLIKVKDRGDVITVENVTGTPAGWYLVRTMPDEGSYWMRSSALGRLTRSASGCG